MDITSKSDCSAWSCDASAIYTARCSDYWIRTPTPGCSVNATMCSSRFTRGAARGRHGHIVCLQLRSREEWQQSAERVQPDYRGVCYSRWSAQRVTVSGSLAPPLSPRHSAFRLSLARQSFCSRAAIVR